MRKLSSAKLSVGRLISRWLRTKETFSEFKPKLLKAREWWAIPKLRPVELDVFFRKVVKSIDEVVGNPNRVRVILETLNREER